MAKYNEPKLDVTMEIPDELTVRMQLKFEDACLKRDEGGEDERYLHIWSALPVIVSAWECPHIELGADLDTVTSPKAARAVKWACVTAWGHVADLGNVPKN